MARFRLVGGRHDGSWYKWTDSRPPPRQIIYTSKTRESDETRAENTYDRMSWGHPGTVRVFFYAQQRLNFAQALTILLERYSLSS